MHKRYSTLFNLVIFTAIFLLYLLALASAEESGHAETTRNAPDHAELAPRIESDAERNAFIFIIDGEEVARLDKTGLYIPGSITFGGTTTDAGRDWVGNYIAGSANGETNEGGIHEEYLPAGGPPSSSSEINLIWLTVQSAEGVGGLNTSGFWYWSSSEVNNSSARIQRFSDGFRGSISKSNGATLVRCVRR